MLSEAEAKTTPESPALYTVPSTSLRLGSGQAIRELDCFRCLNNHHRWLSEAEAKPRHKSSIAYLHL